MSLFLFLTPNEVNYMYSEKGAKNKIRKGLGIAPDIRQPDCSVIVSESFCARCCDFDLVLCHLLSFSRCFGDYRSANR